MADDKKYYYLRLKEDFFESDALLILQAMPDGYIYSDILLKLYLRSLKTEGRLMYKDIIPYTPEIIATLVHHQVGTVKEALKIFKNLGLIEVLDNGAIFMLDIQTFIGKTSTEADRKREYRQRIAEEKKLLIEQKKRQKAGQMSLQTSGQMSGQFPPEIEIEKEIEIEIEIEQKKTNFQQVVNLFNDTCVSFPKVKTLSENRKKAIKARLNTYSIDDLKTLFEKAEASSFLKGANNRNWSATFDWLIKDNNMAKVLEGNYDDKKPHGSSANNDIDLSSIDRANEETLKKYDDSFNDYF